MRQSVGFGIFCSFGVVLTYLSALIYTFLFRFRFPIDGAWWLPLAAGVFLLGFAAAELQRRQSEERQTALAAIGFTRLTSEEGQRL